MTQSEKAEDIVGEHVTVEKLDEIPTSQRRIIKTHLPFQMLNPRLLDTSKVFEPSSFAPNNNKSSYKLINF